MGSSTALSSIGLAGLVTVGLVLLAAGGSRWFRMRARAELVHAIDPSAAVNEVTQALAVACLATVEDPAAWVVEVGTSAPKRVRDVASWKAPEAFAGLPVRLLDVPGARVGARAARPGEVECSGS